MVERQDIDALLIGSLYGELSSADEARLQTHLESHPADRTVLADLTRAREVVRESRILQVQLEPPQAITALLMQEAVRRAPKKSNEEASWFQRFLRSFAAHPAMAAAATLVLVAGIAGTMYVRGGDQFAEQTRSTSAPPADESTVALEVPAAAPATADKLEQNLDGIAGDQGVAPGSGYQVTLREGEGKDRTGGVKGEVELAKRDFGAEVVTKPAKKSPRGDRGIVVTTPDRGPKDLDEPTPKVGAAKAKPADRQMQFDASEVAKDDFAQPPPGNVAGGMAMPPAEPARRPQSNVAPPPPPRAMPSPTTSSTDRRLVDKKTTARPPAQAPAEEKQKNERMEKESSELSWARDQHTRISAQVRAGNCANAASIAVTLSNRAPAYYQQNVENDRDLKQCVAYIATEREKDAELRAKQRARANQRRSADEPAKAAPTTTTK